MLGKCLNPQNDIAFKRLFGTDKNKDILISLLNEVLGGQLSSPIEDVTFLTPIQQAETRYDKTSIVDVLCKDKEGTQYIIEMQVTDKGDFTSRAQYYASKAFITQLKAGEVYKDLKKVIFLAFCNYNVFPDNKHYKSKFITTDEETQRTLDKISFTFIELKKFDEQRDQDISKLTREEKFYYFLKSASQITPEQLQVLTDKNEVLEKAYKELNRVYWTDDQLRIYEGEEKRILDGRAEKQASIDKGKAEGIDMGMAKGKAEGKAEGIAEGIDMGMAKGKAEGKAEGIQYAIDQLVKTGLLSREEAEKRLKNT